ncbi:MAG: pyridoxamine 5'-phosphate oxidase family protein [Hellea sp.]|nr:pyridoxamine 5'-phosphate oxidase family protein [Hellea sp.]
MGKIYDHIPDKIEAFIKRQKMFFVATAPLSGDGHINTSPKGYDSFKIIDDKTVAYLDYGGSGIETHAHVLENGRITIMFCAYEGKADIMRLYGRGEVCAFYDEGFAEKLAWFPDFDRARAIITVHLTRVTDSCGFAVPFYDYKGERDQLHRSHKNKTIEDWQEYRLGKNAESIDGLPGLVRPD